MNSMSSLGDKDIHFRKDVTSYQNICMNKQKKYLRKDLPGLPADLGDKQHHPALHTQMDTEHRSTNQ